MRDRTTVRVVRDVVERYPIPITENGVRNEIRLRFADHRVRQALVELERDGRIIRRRDQVCHDDEPVRYERRRPNAVTFAAVWVCLWVMGMTVVAILVGLGYLAARGLVELV